MFFNEKIEVLSSFSTFSKLKLNNIYPFLCVWKRYKESFKESWFSLWFLMVVLDDQYSPSVLKAGEQAKLLSWEDWLAGEHCLDFTLPLKRTVSSHQARFLVSLYLYSWSLHFLKHWYSIFVVERWDILFRPISKGNDNIIIYSLCFILSATSRSSPPVPTVNIKHAESHQCFTSVPL